MAKAPQQDDIELLGDTLILAIRKGETEYAKDLISKMYGEKGVTGQIMYTAKDGTRPLALAYALKCAAVTGNMEIANYVFDNYPGVLESLFKKNRENVFLTSFLDPALSAAGENGHDQFVGLMLKKFPDYYSVWQLERVKEDLAEAHKKAKTSVDSDTLKLIDAEMTKATVRKEKETDEKREGSVLTTFYGPGLLSQLSVAAQHNPNLKKLDTDNSGVISREELTKFKEKHNLKWADFGKAAPSDYNPHNYDPDLDKAIKAIEKAQAKSQDKGGRGAS